MPDLFTFLYGVLDLSLGGYFLAALILTQTTIAGVTLYLHRCQAHRALELHPVISHFFRLWLWLSTGMNTKAWAAIHRKHHARCETAEDPHSPQVLGLKKVLREGAELYQHEAKNAETLRKFGHGTPDDWIERKLYTAHPSLGIVLMLFIDLLLFGVPGLSLWALQMMWIPIWAAGVINGIGHFYGYRNFESPDAATNIVPIGFFIGGEELHNNHHTYGTSAKFSVKWWEFDIGWFYIRVLSALKLARVNRVPPKPLFDAGRQGIDFATLTAVINNRFQLMADYSRTVMKPVWKLERAEAEAAVRDMFAQVRKRWLREPNQLADGERENVQRLLAHNDRLRVVHEFRERLQQLWLNAGANKEELIAALKRWCEEAEATGIRVLEDFSGKLRMLVPQTV